MIKLKKQMCEDVAKDEKGPLDSSISNNDSCILKEREMKLPCTGTSKTMTNTRLDEDAGLQIHSQNLDLPLLKDDPDIDTVKVEEEEFEYGSFEVRKDARKSIKHDSLDSCTGHIDYLKVAMPMCKLPKEDSQTVKNEVKENQLSSSAISEHLSETTLWDLSLEDEQHQPDFLFCETREEHLNDLCAGPLKLKMFSESKCNICSGKFGNASDLAKHMQFHADKEHYKCYCCPSRFRLQHQLVSHLQTHAGEKPFQCNVCPAKFTLKNGLRNHIRRHTNTKLFKCGSCTKSYGAKSSFERHIQTHTGEKPFRCGNCSACFTRNSDLSRHIRTHTGEKPFKCDSCPACFTVKSHLQNHLRKHTGEKPFKCDTCFTRFAHKSNFVRHLRSHFAIMNKDRL